MFLSWGTLDDVHGIPTKLTGVDRELGLEKDNEKFYSISVT